jgi:RNA polymerase sigma-70 factor, ECF subfamily
MPISGPAHRQAAHQTLPFSNLSRSRRAGVLCFVDLALEGRRGPTAPPVLERAAVSALPSIVTPSSSADMRTTLRESRRSHDAREDADLVRAALRGVRAAEETLYRRHASSVLRLATRLLRSEEDALDVLQDTFVTALDDLADLRDPAAFRPWVHRTAVRLVHRRFRKRKLLALLGLDRADGELSLEALADEAASPEARVELRLLDRALGILDDKARIAWMLRHIEGLSLDETAHACGCSLATAKRRISAGDDVVQRHLAGGAA